MKKKNILIIISAVLFLFSCEKEKIVELEVEVNKTFRWKSHPAFQYENSILLNSISVDNSYMAISGTNFFSKVGGEENFGSHDSIFEDNLIKQYNAAIKPTNRKIPITSQVTVTCKETKSEFGKVNFISTTDYGSLNSYLYMGEVDASFIGFSFDRPIWNDCVAINNKGQVLIPYKSLLEGESQLRLLLVDTQQTGNSVNPTEILDTKIIKIEDTYQNRVSCLMSIDDIFFVTTDSKTYRIDSEGDLTDKYDDYQLYSVISKDDTLFAFGYNFKLRQNEFLHSTNHGMIWNKISTSESEIAYLNFTTIENKIIGYWRSQIWQFSFSDNGYNVVELDNEGLVGKIITSIVVYKDKVYATTKSGLFYQDVANLFEIKETEGN